MNIRRARRRNNIHFGQQQGIAIFHRLQLREPAETLITIFSLPYTHFQRLSVLFFIVNPRKSAVTAINLQSCERPTFIIALACEV